jgi:hypothetical protein
MKTLYFITGSQDPTARKPQQVAEDSKGLSNSNDSLSGVAEVCEAT